MRTNKFLLILLALITPFFNVFSQSKFPGCPKGQWIKLSLTNEMIQKAKLLDKGEELDQYRDWIKIAAIKKMGFDKATNFRLLYDCAPVRTEENSAISNYSYGEGRFFIGPHESLYILTPSNIADSEKLIGEIADEYRMLTGKKPSAVRHLQYSIDTTTSALSFEYSSDIDPVDIFSAKYGYEELSVADRKSLATFLSDIDDLVGVFNTTHGVVLCGRRYRDRQKGLDAEDVTDLYKAGNSILKSIGTRLQTYGLQEQYDNYIKDRVNYYKANIVQTTYSFTDAEIEERLKLAMPYSTYLQGILSNLKTQLSFFSPGFSLDWGMKDSAFSGALTMILNGDTAFVNSLDFLHHAADSTNVMPTRQLARDQPFEQWKAKEEARTEKSFATFLGLVPDTSSVESHLYSILPDSVSDTQNQKTVRTVIEAFRNSDRIIRAICKQLNDKPAGEKLQLYNYLLRYLTGQYKFNLTGDINPAWPTDKQLLYGKISQDVGDVVRQKPLNFELGSLKDSSNSTIIKTLLKRTGKKSLTWDDLGYLLQTDTAKLTELEYLGTVLNQLKLQYQYQKATYIGDLQGTKIGMTLFYTDLMMKLWGFDYKNSAPKNIPGFFSELNFKVSPFYEDELDKHPETRFWLGPLYSAMQAYDNQTKLYFSTYATKVFCASSNDLFPGVEVRANYIDRRFTDWWNRHYVQVADYEPEYHRLNQIMKWCATILWLKKFKQFSWLDDEPKATDSLSFADWYRSNPTLKVKLELPFLDGSQLGETTECLDLLQSKAAELYENPLKYDEPNFTSFIGGVSLLSESEFETNILLARNRRVADQLLARRGLTVTKEGSSELLINEGKYQLKSAENEVVVDRAESGTLESKELQVKNFGLQREIRTIPEELLIKQSLHSAPEISSDGLKLSEAGNTIQLTPAKSDIQAFQDYVAKTKTKIGFNQFGDESIQIDGDVGHFYVKLPNSDAYMVGRWGLKEKIDPFINRVTNSPHIALSNDGLIYYDLSVMSRREFMTTFMENRWLSIDDGDLVLARHNAENGQPLLYRLGNHTGQIRLADDRIFIKSLDPALDETVARALEDFDPPTIRELLNDGRNEVYAFTKEGPAAISKPAANMHNHSDLIKELLPDASGKLNCIVVDPTATEIKFVNWNTLNVPELSTLTADQKEVLSFINERLAMDKQWFIPGEPISIEDVLVLRKIALENDNLANSYYTFKDLDLTDNHFAVVDLGSQSETPQVLIRTGSGKPQVLTLDGIGTKMDKITAGLTHMYQNSEDITYEELLQRTEPAAKLLREVSRSTSATKIVTIEPKGFNSELINNLHNVSESQIFYKDQPGIDQSKANADKDITIDFPRTEMLIPFDIIDSAAREMIPVIDSLKSFGVKLITNATRHDYVNCLDDTTITQVIILGRDNGYGLLFSDGAISETGLQFPDNFGRPKKDFIYLISNMADSIGYSLAYDSQASRIIMSSYTPGNAETFKAALNSLYSIYSKAHREDLKLSPAGPPKGIPPGPRPPETIETPETRSENYRPKDLNRLLKKVQQEQLMELRLQKLRPIEFFKSIPTFKVYQKNPLTSPKDC